MSPEKLKHLDYIQATITRMATVSFQIKAWNIGLVTAVLAFAAGDKNPAFLWAAFLPAAMLWFLDSFFLRQERLFRTFYNDVRQPDSMVETFSMDSDDYKHQEKNAALASILVKNFKIFSRHDFAYHRRWCINNFESIN
jgi:hypothetical protein